MALPYNDDVLGSCLLATSMWKMSEILTSPMMIVLISRVDYHGKLCMLVGHIIEDNGDANVLVDHDVDAHILDTEDGP